MSLFVRYCCIAHWLLHCALIVCIFLGNFKSFWKYKPISLLIIITMLTNNSSIFWSSIKLLHFGLLNGDGGTTTWTIFMCHLFCFSFCWWDLIGRFIVGTVFSFQDFFSTLNSLCNTVSFSGKEESSEALSILPVLLGVSQS